VRSFGELPEWRSPRNAHQQLGQRQHSSPRRANRCLSGAFVASICAAVAMSSTAFGEGRNGQAAAYCSPALIRTFNGYVRMRFMLHGQVSCATAHRVVRTYYAQAPRRCQGSGCFIALSHGWSCETASPANVAAGGSITECLQPWTVYGMARARATIETYKYR
jgi:hypothetical protein